MKANKHLDNKKTEKSERGESVKSIPTNTLTKSDSRNSFVRMGSANKLKRTASSKSIGKQTFTSSDDNFFGREGRELFALYVNNKKILYVKHLTRTWLLSFSPHLTQTWILWSNEWFYKVNYVDKICLSWHNQSACQFSRQSDKVNSNFKYKNLQVGEKEKEPRTFAMFMMCLILRWTAPES